MRLETCEMIHVYDYTTDYFSLTTKMYKLNYLQKIFSTILCRRQIQRIQIFTKFSNKMILKILLAWWNFSNCIETLFFFWLRLLPKVCEPNGNCSSGNFSTKVFCRWAVNHPCRSFRHEFWRLLTDHAFHYVSLPIHALEYFVVGDFCIHEIR